MLELNLSPLIEEFYDLRQTQEVSDFLVVVPLLNPVLLL